MYFLLYQLAFRNMENKKDWLGENKNILPTSPNNHNNLIPTATILTTGLPSSTTQTQEIQYQNPRTLNQVIRMQFKSQTNNPNISQTNNPNCQWILPKNDSNADINTLEIQAQPEANSGNSSPTTQILPNQNQSATAAMANPPKNFQTSQMPNKSTRPGPSS